MSPARRRAWWEGQRRGPDRRPPPSRGAGSRRTFGRTWWGKAWVTALEQRAALDRNRLPRGRGYARRGTATPIVVEPGAVRTRVQGTRAKPYDVVVRVAQFDSAQWDRVLDTVAAQVGRTAALLDGELPPEVIDDVTAAGLSLLPGPGDLQPRCSCPDVADPCKHAAAVCYLVADLMDADPFTLLTLRGRPRDEVLRALRRRRVGRAVLATSSPADGAAHAPTVPAREAYRRELGPRPVVPLAPKRPGRPAAATLEPPAESAVTGDALVALAADAAARGWALLYGEGDGGLHLTRDEDLARRGASLLGGGQLPVLARRAGLTARELTSRAIAWRHGDAGGLAALLGSWQPTADDLAPGRAALAELPGPPSPVRARTNRLTREATQLRLGQDGLWYRFRKSIGSWDLDATPSLDPRELLRSDPD